MGSSPKENSDQFRARQNLKFISEIYRNHWGIFLKGFRFYLATCSALMGVSAYNHTNKALLLFSGCGIIAASVCAFIGCQIAAKFMEDYKNKIDQLSEELKFVSFMNDHPISIVKVLRIISLLVGLAGVFQLIYALELIEISLSNRV